MLLLLTSSQLEALRTQRAHCRVMPRLPLAVTSPTTTSFGFSSYLLGLLSTFPTVPESSQSSMPSPYLLGKAPLCLSESLQQKVAGR